MVPLSLVVHFEVQGLAHSLIWLVLVPVVHLITLILGLMKMEACTLVLSKTLTILARNLRRIMAL